MRTWIERCRTVAARRAPKVRVVQPPVCWRGGLLLADIGSDRAIGLADDMVGNRLRQIAFISLLFCSMLLTKGASEDASKGASEGACKMIDKALGEAS